MCRYYEVVADCGHPLLLSGPSCKTVYLQLQRINDPTNHNWLQRHSLPFEIPGLCLPNANNILPAPDRHIESGVGLSCSVECQNNSLYGQRVGEPDAYYGPGSARKGVGYAWRQPDGNTMGVVKDERSERGERGKIGARGQIDESFEEVDVSGTRTGQIGYQNPFKWWVWDGDVMGTLPALNNGESGEEPVVS